MHSREERPLSKSVVPISTNHVAVHSELARSHSRLVVDEYQRTPAGAYKLASVATDLLRYLARSGVTASLVPDLAKAAAGEYNSVRGHARGACQGSNQVLMVAPTAFGFNEQTAADNHFMHAAARPGDDDSLPLTVLREFAGLHHQLTEVHGVSVDLMQHSLAHNTPDAVFPNNWFSTHAAGEAAGGCAESTLVLYPMKCPNRAAERRPELIEMLQGRGYTRVVDLSGWERRNKYFEGTGVLDLDRINGVAYVSISERADRAIAEEWVDKLGYKELVTFHSEDARGKTVYHTNVMMAVGTDVAIVCGESVVDARERSHLFATLGKTHEIVDISCAQIDALCGNAIELQDDRGLPVMAMSTQAYNAFTPEQRAVILNHCADIVHAPIDKLESVGGGSVRCTLAELF